MILFLTLQDACVDKLEKFMRGDTGKPDQAIYHGMNRRQEGNLTPSGTPGSNSVLPSNGRAPNIQRTISNESGKGSYSSDKDVHYPNAICNGSSTAGGGCPPRD